MKSLLAVLSTFLSIPLLIILCIIYLSYIGSLKNSLKLSQNNSKVAYAALPSTQNLLSDKINSKDARIEILSTFFKKYKSDLLPFAQDIVSAADKYNLDYRLVPSIAMQESNLCKKAPKDSFNCWGFGIYGKNLKKFTSYPRAIDAVTRTLSLEYKQYGLIEPAEIMHKYTPGSNGSWAKGVNQYMAELAGTVL